MTARRLLLGGAFAAPLFIVAVLTQAATRPGYDLTRHPASVLANGDLGWVQITTFLLSGALMLGAAVGLRRVEGGRWSPILFAVVGVGLIGAGVFRLDPLDGFPPGTPAGVPTSMSWHSVLHNVFATPAFLAMIVGCFVLARRFGAAGQRRWAVAGRVGGVLFIVGLVWAFAGGAAGALTLFLGVSAAWLWLSASTAGLARGHRAA